MRLACAAWPLEWHRSWESYAAKLTRWVSEAAHADLLVFPEYGGMEAALTERPAFSDSGAAWLIGATVFADRAVALHVDLAARHATSLLMGSLPVATASGIVNRAHLIGPTGVLGHQDKQIPTPWERRYTDLVGGDPLRVFDTAWGRIGILICHDAEFPPLARACPCDLLLVPACTDAATGAARVRNAARARALEGQCITALAQTLGDVPGCAYLDTNRGRAGIYAPPDRGFPDDGIISEGMAEAPGWVTAEIDLAALAAGRDTGEVAIAADWAEAERRAALAGLAVKRP